MIVLDFSRVSMPDHTNIDEQIDQLESQILDYSYRAYRSLLKKMHTVFFTSTNTKPLTALYRKDFNHQVKPL